MSPPEKELWYQAGMSFQNFHEVHLAMCELDCLQCIPLAMFGRVVKMEGEFDNDLSLAVSRGEQ